MSTGDSTDESDESDESGEIGYAAAIAELDDIVRRLDDEALDIDALAGEVERAAVLITTCRDRLGAARLRVTEIVSDLELDPD
jgi:exodeoxyribonuclease VII small subunit